MFSCSLPTTQVQKGAYVGSATGTTARAILEEAIIGGDTESTWIGTGVGAVVGGLGGAGLGRVMDNQEAVLWQQLADSESANVQRNVGVLTVTFNSNYVFDADFTAFKPCDYSKISRGAQVLGQYLQTNILVANHTDSIGSELHDQEHPERRAKSVKNSS